MLYGIQQQLHHRALEGTPFSLIHTIGIIEVGRNEICIEHNFERVGLTHKAAMLKFIRRMVHTAID